jgi:hypothetical protein
MLVQQILNSKPDPRVASSRCRRISTVAEAVEPAVLAPHRGRDGIADGKRVDGILSERDIVRELGRRGAACLSFRWIR